MFSLIKFSRDSFDRFGDDLCEQILSYLSISDCFELQCVSKQFNSKIFSKQTKLTLAYFKYDEQNSIIKKLFVANNHNLMKRKLMYKYICAVNHESLEYVLKKCVNINSIAIDARYVHITDQTIDIISNHCKHIKHLTIDVGVNAQISANCWLKFAQTCASHLHTFKVSEEVIDVLKIILQFTPKLKCLRSSTNIEMFFDQYFSENQYNSIETISCYKIDDQRFISFADHFATQLKSLHVIVGHETDFNSLKNLSRFRSLEYLYCRFSESDKNYNEILKSVGINCKNLKVLVIEYIRSPFFDIFSDGFRAMETLVIKGRWFDECASFNLLKNCVNLKHLRLSCVKAKQTDFSDIHKHLPQLQSIDLYALRLDYDEEMSEVMRHLQRLPNLCDIKCGFYDYNCYDFTIEHLLRFIDNCLTVKRIGIYSRVSSIDINSITRVQQFVLNNSNRKLFFNSLYR